MLMSYNINTQKSYAKNQISISKHQFLNTISSQTRNMAGRSRPNVSAISYEDFVPQCKQREEQGENILLIHLPGFSKEQLNVTYVESSRTIKVQGEGALEKNRRSRFNQSFPVPRNCIVEKIQGSFRNGVLTITMPKQTTAQIASVKETTPPKAISEHKPLKDQKKDTPPEAASTSGFEKQGDQTLQSPQTPIPQPNAPMATTPPKAQTKAEALQPSKQQEETQTEVAPIATATKQTQEMTVGSAAEIVEKEAESKAGLKNQVKEVESGKTKDSTMSETNIPKISEKEQKFDRAEKPKKGGSTGNFLEKAKEMKGMDTIMKTVKRLATDDSEDRQLLINIGVSVLVIVVLGAYITYSYQSSGKTKC